MYNFGGSYAVTPKATRRLIICPTYNGSSVLNKIAKSSVSGGSLPHTVLQALYNTYQHAADPLVKHAATPQLSEFTVTDVDAQESTSEWYKAVMQLGERDCSFILNDVAPHVMGQLALLTAAGALSFYMITADDYLGCKQDATHFIPLQIQEGSLKVLPYKPRGYSEHSKNMITFRLNEADAMNGLVYQKISGGYVTSDSDHFSLIDCTCTVSSITTGGATFTIKRTFANPMAPSIDVPVTGILFTEMAAVGTDVSDDEAPAATENWTSSTAGVYVWAETGVFTSGKTYRVKISHPRIDVADVTFVIP
jgi:hypothetical protein